MSDFEIAVIERLDAILAELKTARDERAEDGEAVRRAEAARARKNG